MSLDMHLTPLGERMYNEALAELIGKITQVNLYAWDCFRNPLTMAAYFIKDNGEGKRVFVDFGDQVTWDERVPTIHSVTLVCRTTKGDEICRVMHRVEEGDKVTFPVPSIDDITFTH